MVTTEEAQVLQHRLEALTIKKRHTLDCQTANRLAEWQPLGDKRKRCACPYWSCGVHSSGEKFARRSTGENTLERANAVVKLRLESGTPKAILPTASGTTISDAMSDFMGYTRDGGARQSTLTKYQTLMDQLQAFCEWKGLRYVHELNQDAVIEFRRAWEDAGAGYKQGRVTRFGKPLWGTQGIGTCRRNTKTMRLFFNRGITRKWKGVTEDPTRILQFPKQPTKKTKQDTKYLTGEQFAALLAMCDNHTHMKEYNRQRIKTLIITMRWTGLRISDAVVLTADNIKDGVLYKTTKKASTPVQIPLHPQLVEALAKLNPYSGGYYFWNRQEEGSKPSTVQSNFSMQLAVLFQEAAIESDGHHVSHMLRNSFAVDLLEKGAPMADVSLMLGHASVKTTELYYADFTKKYMDTAEAKIRKIWALPEGGTLA